MYDTTTPNQDLMPMRNPNIEVNTRRQKGSKLVFDGVELPSVRGISARQPRSGGEEDGNETDERMEIRNGTNTAAGRKATRGRRIAKQRKRVMGNIPASDRVQTLSEQSFARCEGGSSVSRGTSHLAYCTVG
jgi:hypothetical protein